MKYIIMCGGNYETFETPRQLTKIKGEPLVARTIRLLQEQGVEDIAISSFQTYNGKLSQEQETELENIASVTNFNIDQFHIEHAEVERDIQVKAGAGTGLNKGVKPNSFSCS